MAEGIVPVGASVVTYADGDGWRAGFALDGRIVDSSLVPALQGRGHLSVRALMALGPEALAEACAQATSLITDSDAARPVDEVILGPAITDPTKILCIGLNYRAHAAESNVEVPTAPTVFAKFQNCLIGPSAPIVMPSVSTQIDYEGELAAIIGKRCKEVSEAEALGCVAGYTAFNDVSARDLQHRVSQWTIGKAIDTFAPIGPGIVPASAVGDPQALQLVTRVNGQVLQSESTAQMVFSVAALISYISHAMTLEPGDVIATGTPSGVGASMEPPLFLKAGDEVVVEIERIGLLRNPVIAGQPVHA